VPWPCFVYFWGVACSWAGSCNCIYCMLSTIYIYIYIYTIQEPWSLLTAERAKDMKVPDYTDTPHGPSTTHIDTIQAPSSHVGTN
jgi:hypothetical protein